MISTSRGVERRTHGFKDGTLPQQLCAVTHCKKAASANVETVFSGAGKFTEEAKSTGPTLLRRMVKLHYNWKYTFLRPSIEQVIRRYKEKWLGQTGKVAAMAAIVRWLKKQPPLAQKAEAVGVGAGPSAEADAADAEESE